MQSGQLASAVVTAMGLTSSQLTMAISKLAIHHLWIVFGSMWASS